MIDIMTLIENKGRCCRKESEERYCVANEESTSNVYGHDREPHGPGMFRQCFNETQDKSLGNKDKCG